MPRRNVSYRPVRYILRRTNINSSRPKDQPIVKDSTNRLQAQNESIQNHNKAGNSYPINNILVLPQNSETLINVIGSNNKNFSFKKVLRKLSNRRRKEKQRLKKAQAKQDIKPDITKMKKLHAKKTTINRHTIILSDSEDESFIKREPKNTSDKSTDKSSADDDVILVETNRENEVIEIEDSCNDDLTNSKADCANSSQYKTTERTELLSTPESSTSNDFLENSNSNINTNFNFSLHGSEFKDSEFLKPSVPVDVSESGSISSVSDISSSVKANVFNVVDFPKERENLFDENNLEKFKDSITPQRHSLRDDVNNSKDERRDLPTLSHIQSDDSQLRRVRGRSIIRELVNDRAYVLLASAEKKIKKKRKSRDEAETAIVDTEVGESISSDPAKKKKKRKKKKDDENNTDTYSQFTDDVESSDIISSSPMKSVIESKKDKNRKIETGNVQDVNQNFNLVVRNDLFPEMETDASVNSKKARKKDKESVVSVVEDNEHKKKHKKSKKQTDESPEVLPDSSKKRKKEKSLSECSGNETIEVTKQKSKKKKKKNLESEEGSYQLITDDCDATLDKIEVSEVNEIVTPLIKHQKKTLNPPDISVNDESILEVNTELPTTTEKTNTDGKSCISEITDIPTLATNIDKNTIQINSNKELDKAENNTVISGSQTLLILNELPEPSNDCKIEVINPETSGIPSIPEESIFDSKSEQSEEFNREQSTKSDVVVDNAEKKIDAESPSDKSQSVWNMCSSNFFSSSESLFVVSDVRTVTEVENKPEANETLVSATIDKVSIANPSTTGRSYNISNIVIQPQNTLESNKATNINQSSSSEQIPSIPLGEVKGNNCEELKLPQGSTNLQNTDKSQQTVTQEKEDIPILIEPKKEIIDDNRLNEVSCLQNIEMVTPPQITENVSIETTEVVNVKTESTEAHAGTSEENNSDIVTVIGSSFLGEDTAKKAHSHISPEVIKDIIQEKDNIKSVTKLCEFLEGGKDPNDVLRKVSMIKQAFLASADTNSSTLTTSKDDDVFSISSDNSDSSSIIYVENDTPIVDIEDDISLANCQLEIPKDRADAVEVPQEQSIGLSKAPMDKEDTVIATNPQVHTPTPYALRCGEVGNYAKNLDKYEVEAIQKTMKNDPKLWQISSDDIPTNRPPVRGKRCIRCKEIGHLVMHCPNRDMLPRCYLCGLEGHLEFRCPNKLCTKCGTKSANMQSFCDSCKHYSRMTCSLCSMRGHPRYKCPDLWRRYHLTVEPGPLVQTDGMKLKNKEDLWCSSCAKRGHLEYYCYGAMKNRGFQQLDPRIHYYEDVYEPKSNMVENTSTGGVISMKTLHNLQSHLDNPPKKAKDLIVESKTKEIPNEIPNKKVVEMSVRNPIQDNSLVNADIDLPPDFVVIDEIPTVVKNQIPSGSEKFPGRLDESQLSRDDLEKSSTSVVVTDKTNISKEPVRTDKDNSNIQTNSMGHDPFHSIREYLRNSSKRLDYNRTDLFVPDCDMKYFFMTSDVGLLKKFLTKELEFLANFSVRVKDMFFKYNRYSMDLLKPVEKREIPYERHAQYQKQLNMLLFGKEHFKAGKIFLTKLHSFVGTATGFFTDAMRESLYLAYDYIFSQELHQHTQYIYLLRLLMDKYGYRKK